MEPLESWQAENRLLGVMDYVSTIRPHSRVQPREQMTSMSVRRP